MADIFKFMIVIPSQPRFGHTPPNCLKEFNFFKSPLIFMKFAAKCSASCSLLYNVYVDVNCGAIPLSRKREREGLEKMIEECSGVERQLRKSQNCYNTHYIRKTCLELSWERERESGRGSGKMIEECSGVERQIRTSQNCYNTHYIRKTCPYNEYPLKPHFYTVKLGYSGVYLLSYFFVQSIDCEY